MSLIPIRSFSDQLPVIFVEARMQGNPNAVLAQLGLSLDADECNVALFRCNLIKKALIGSGFANAASI
ncbi:hypothetical protein Tcan_15861 [Toxocara canis]|uniref:Uncharacterized protein n=1 Tax=Toxocara canis TaxID=6265 RepID=A0A0B2UY54_TOXCA|nr:hypothetical protein Tcan_15861 [Toxocara canis]